MPDQYDEQETSHPGDPTAGPAASGAPVSAIEQRLMILAEDLGTWLGTAERKTSDFVSQQNLKEHLVKIRDTAARLLAQIEKGRERSR